MYFLFESLLNRLCTLFQLDPLTSLKNVNHTRPIDTDSHAIRDPQDGDVEDGIEVAL